MYAIRSYTGGPGDCRRTSIAPGSAPRPRRNEAAEFDQGGVFARLNTVTLRITSYSIHYTKLYDFAAWSFTSKLAAGMMLGIVGFSLDLAGFEAGAAQTDVVV